jgi:hypothetical protein
MLFVNVYGPLLHEHAEGELDTKAVIHAHFPDPEEATVPDGASIGFRHSHANALWLDGFMTIAPDSVQVTPMVIENVIKPDPQPVQSGFVPVDVPRAHSPPLLESAIPRSPPA